MIPAMRYEVVTAETPLGEGPVWCPDGTLVISLISPAHWCAFNPRAGDSRSSSHFRVAPTARRLRTTAASSSRTNGGIDFTVFSTSTRTRRGEIPYRPVLPGPPSRRARRQRERAGPGGAAGAPTILIVAPDGTIYFTKTRRPTAVCEARVVRVASGAMRGAGSATPGERLQVRQWCRAVSDRKTPARGGPGIALVPPRSRNS